MQADKRQWPNWRFIFFLHWWKSKDTDGCLCHAKYQRWQFLSSISRVAVGLSPNALSFFCCWHSRAQKHLGFCHSSMKGLQAVLHAIEYKHLYPILFQVILIFSNSNTMLYSWMLTGENHHAPYPLLLEELYVGITLKWTTYQPFFSF